MKAFGSATGLFFSRSCNIPLSDMITMLPYDDVYFVFKSCPPATENHF